MALAADDRADYARPVNQDGQPGEINPEQIVAVIESELRQDRPQWAKLAAAKVLHFIIPKIEAREWLKRLGKPELLVESFSPEEMPWLFGRGFRCLAEMKRIGHENFPVLKKAPWLFTMKVEQGRIILDGGKGLEGILLQEFQKALRQPTEFQVSFWRSFADGFERDLSLRTQDVKALIVYVFLATNWREAQKCTTLRELFEFVFSRIPKPQCPPSEDEIDFEERQVKWFDKLCQRNLGISLKQRGRPRQK